MVEIVFYRPIYLLFLAAIPLLVLVHFYSLRYVKKKALLFANFAAIERITGGETVPKNYLLLLMRVLTLTLFVFAVAGITLKYAAPSLEYDLMLCLDSSTSMSASDLAPTRLEASKNVVSSFVELAPSGSMIGVAAFSSTTVVLTEPTSDKSIVRKAINSIKVQRVGGTAIGDALIASSNALAVSERPKAIVLLTDGQSNTGTPVRDAIEYAKSKEVKVFTVGVGTQSANITELDVLTGLDEESLKTISFETGGKYYSGASNDALKKVFEDLAGKTSEKTEAIDLSIYLVALAFLLVFIDWGLTGSRYRIIP